MSLQTLMKDYHSINTKIAELFDIGESCWHFIYNHLDNKWHEYGEEMPSEIAFMSEGEDEYDSLEVYGTSKWVSKCNNYTLFVCDTCCGERAMYVFNNANKESE